MPAAHAAIDELVRDGLVRPSWNGRLLRDRHRTGSGAVLTIEAIAALPLAPAMRYCAVMARKKRYLTATMADGYVKTIGPTAAPFTHYWRIVAHLNGGRTEVFWGHATSAKDAKAKEALTVDAAKRYGWSSFDFEVVELTEN
jgi:hypothetical protein